MAEKAELKEALQVMFGDQGHVGIVDDQKPAATSPEPPKEPSAAPAKEPAAAPAKQPAAEGPKKPKAAPRSKPRQEAVMDPEERDRIVAQAAVTGAAAAASARGKDVTDDLPTRSDLTDKQRDTLAVLNYMGKKNPTHATLADRTMDFWQKEQEYIKKWEKENPDKKFNFKDEEHAQWYEEHEPQFEDEDFEAAKKSMEKEAIEARVDDQVNRKLSEKEQLDAERELQKSEADKVQGVVDDAELSLIASLVPEAKKFFTKDGKVVLTDEQWAAFAEEDPAAAKILRKEGEYLARKMKEFERLNRYPLTYGPDFANRLHQSLAQTALDMEDKILSLPPDKQVHNGKRFLTQGEWSKKVHSIKSNKELSDDQKIEKLKKLSAAHWILQPEHVRAGVIKHHERRAKDKLSEIREIEAAVEKRLAKRAGTPPPAAPAATPPAQPAAAAPAPPKKPQREVAPSSAASGGVMPTNGEGKAGTGGALKTLEAIGI